MVYTSGLKLQTPKVQVVFSLTNRVEKSTRLTPLTQTSLYQMLNTWRPEGRELLILRCLTILSTF